MPPLYRRRLLAGCSRHEFSLAWWIQGEQALAHVQCVPAGALPVVAGVCVGSPLCKGTEVSMR